MNWFYADNGQQRGPIPEAEFERLIQFGAIQPDTLVWHDGMPAWKPLREVRPGSVPGQPPAFASAGGGEARTDAGVSEEEVRARDYALDVSDCFTRGWELVKTNPGSVIGASALVYLCLFGINAVPYIGPIAALVLNGPLLGGLWLYFIAEHRKQSPKPGDAFSGFGPRFLDLFLGSAVPSVLGTLVFLPLILPALGIAFAAALGEGAHSHSGREAAPIILTIAIAFGVLIFLICLCISVYLQVCWMFTLALVADKRMSFWPAMALSRAVVRKHFWVVLLLAILAWLCSMGGFLLCCVGIFLTGPIAFGAFTYAYEKLFGDLRPMAVQ